jgi:hypothetical protein
MAMSFLPAGKTFSPTAGLVDRSAAFVDAGPIVRSRGMARADQDALARFSRTMMALLQ